MGITTPSSPVSPKRSEQRGDEKKLKVDTSAKDDSVSTVESMATAATKNPVPLLIFVLVFVGVLASGLYKFELEERIEELWIEDGSIVNDEMDYVKDHKYLIQHTETQLLTTTVNGDPNNNVMTRFILDKHLQAAKAIANITVEHEGHTYGYQDVCGAVAKYRTQCQRVTLLDCKSSHRCLRRT